MKRKQPVDYPRCKRCQSDQTVKCGFVNHKQRYMCKSCDYHFVKNDDDLISEGVASQKALCVLLYSLGHLSFRAIAEILNIDHVLVYRWLDNAGCLDACQTRRGDARKVAFTDFRKYIKTQESTLGGMNPITVGIGELLPGMSVLLMLKKSDV